MSVTPENDQDGVDRDRGDDGAESGEVHENTRSSAEGVEEQPETGGGASPGLIGNGAAVDPRYTAQR